MKFKGMVLCAAIALAAPTIRAADAQGNYAIWGAGGRSCHQFSLAAADPAKLASFRDFLMGYLTAFNTVADDTYDAIGGEPLETTIGWLDEYCDEHKMDSFERALTQLLVARHEMRSRLPPGARRRPWGAGQGAGQAAPGSE